MCANLTIQNGILPLTLASTEPVKVHAWTDHVEKLRLANNHTSFFEMMDKPTQKAVGFAFCRHRVPGRLKPWIPPNRIHKYKNWHWRKFLTRLREVFPTLETVKTGSIAARIKDVPIIER